MKRPMPDHVAEKVDSQIKGMLRHIAWQDRADVYQHCWLAALSAWQRWRADGGACASSFIWIAVRHARAEYYRLRDGRPSRARTPKRGRVHWHLPEDQRSLPVGDAGLAIEQALAPLTPHERLLVLVWAHKSQATYARMIGRDISRVSIFAARALAKAKAHACGGLVL